MRECRFSPWCSYIEDHGCAKDSCRHYQPMPDVDALLGLADRMEHMSGMGALLAAHGLAMAAASIREACGEVES